MKINSDPAVIYVAVRGDDAIKIGFTRNLSQRTKSLAYQFPDSEIIDAHAIPGGRVRETELHAHGLVWAYRADGEWFRISPLEARCAIVSASAAVEAGLPLPSVIVAWRRAVSAKGRGVRIIEFAKQLGIVIEPPK